MAQRLIHAHGRRAAALACLYLIGAVPRAHAQSDAASDGGVEPSADAGTLDPLVAPSLLEAPPIVYPQGETAPASVELELTLNEAGTVVDAVVARSASPAFDAAALALAPRLRFAPATRAGIPIPARIPFRIDFEPPPPPSALAPTPAPATAPAPAPAPILGTTNLEIRGAPPPQEPTRHTLALEQVRTVPGTGGDVLRAVETMPGVARPAWGEGTLIVRGSAPDDTQVFLDGTPIPYAYHLGDGTSVVPGDLLERLDYYPGNFGPVFGRGMGGVVDVGLRAPRRDRLGGLLQIDMIDARAMVEAPIGAHGGVLLAARRSWLDAWIGSVLENDATSLTAAPVYWDAQAIVEHDLSSSTRARLSLFGADDRFTVVLDAPDEHDPVRGGEIGGFTRFLRAQLRIDTDLDPRTRVTHTLSWGFTDADQRFGGDGFAWQAQELALRSDLRVELADWLTSSTGIDAGIARYDVAAQFRPYPESNGVPGPYFARPSRTIDATAWLVRPAIYTGFEIVPVRGLTLLPGVRADHAADTDQLTVDPRLNARWDVIEAPRRTTLKGGLGLYHQPPLVEQSASATGGKGVESSRALHASAGVEQEIAPAFSIGVEGFYKRLSDLVVAQADETRPIGARFDNTGDGRVIGLEALLRYEARDSPLGGWIAYTLSRSERRDRPALEYTTFAWDQTHVLSAVANLELGRRWTLGARYRYVTGAPYTPYSGGVVDLDAGAYSPLTSAALSSARLDPFHQLDLRIEKQWEFEAWKLAAYLEVRNVYNHRSAEGVTYSYDYAQRSSVQGLPILPVLGVRGEL